ncbi:MAG TPA: hypothetical protein VER55_03765 [Ardenticatenaceae bacterium]|nr:hypothetical protein [Ardenticatenaceae bacterium]
MAAMAQVSGQPAVLSPGEFSRGLLQALEASEGRRKRRKRDTTPDAIGMGIKRELLRKAVEDDPAPEAFEAWLLSQVLAADATGPVRAVCREILTEYTLAGQDPSFSHWLMAGAPSADAEATQDRPVGSAGSEPSPAAATSRSSRRDAK